MLLPKRIRTLIYSMFALLLASCGGGGGGSPGSGGNSGGGSTYGGGSNYYVSGVTSFTATADDRSVSLSWVNPTSNFAGVMIRRGTDCSAVWDSPSTGTLITNTTGTTVVDTTVTNGVNYCYAAWAYDANGKYSSAQIAAATPKAYYVTVNAGADFTLAVKSDGTLWAWGSNWSGTLGDGCATAPTCYDSNTPRQVGTDNTWRTVSAGLSHSVAIKQDGTLWSWGDNQHGELGVGCDGTVCVFISTPTKVGTDTNWASVSTGHGFTVAIKTDGTLWTWGANNDGQLGDGCALATASSTSNCTGKISPYKVGTDSDWATVAAGADHVLAIKKNGTLWAWGSNQYGQLGRTPIAYDSARSTPVQVGTATDWKKIGAGDLHSIAIKANGTLWTWGHNEQGQLGDGCTIGSTCSSTGTPTQVGTDTNWKDADGGVSLTIALKTDGTLWTWGNYATSTGASSSVPLQEGTGTAWTQVSGGGGGSTSGVYGGYFMAIESLGSNKTELKSWGTDLSGELGYGSASPVWTPTRVY